MQKTPNGSVLPTIYTTEEKLQEDVFLPFGTCFVSFLSNFAIEVQKNGNYARSTTHGLILVQKDLIVANEYSRIFPEI